MALTQDEFARRLRHARETKGLNQTDVARQADVDIRTYQRWESGERTPYKRHLPVLAGVLDVEIEHLTGPLSTGDQLTRIENVLNDNNRLLRQLAGQLASLPTIAALQDSYLKLLGETPPPAEEAEPEPAYETGQAPQRAGRKGATGQ